MTVHTTHIYTDGGCIRKPNEIPKGRYCYFVEESNQAQLYYEDSITNNQAEYLAVLKLFEDKVISDPNESYIVYSDSEMMVCQINGTRAIKNAALLVFAKKYGKRGKLSSCYMS